MEQLLFYFARLFTCFTLPLLSDPPPPLRNEAVVPPLPPSVSVRWYDPHPHPLSPCQGSIIKRLSAPLPFLLLLLLSTHFRSDFPRHQEKCEWHTHSPAHTRSLRSVCLKKCGNWKCWFCATVEMLQRGRCVCCIHMCFWGFLCVCTVTSVCKNKSKHDKRNFQSLKWHNILFLDWDKLDTENKLLSHIFTFNSISFGCRMFNIHAITFKLRWTYVLS